MNPADSASRSDGVRVCAIVVTYNRRALLRECLHALFAQTTVLSRVLVVDNASTDGTETMLANDFSRRVFSNLEVIRLSANAGGAGGFHEGLKAAMAAGYDWMWLMDDDTIPQQDTLAELFAARARFPEERQPDLLASKVVWTDGTLHHMNVAWPDQRDAEARFLCAENQTFPLRAATFVSLLLHCRLVKQYGLPIADYFVWGEDVEYSGRILKENLGVAVPASVAMHKTPRKHSNADPSPRFYYYVRNTLWMIARSGAFSQNEKTKLTLQFFRSLGVYLQRSRLSLKSFNVIFRGLRDGFITRPRR